MTSERYLFAARLSISVVLAAGFSLWLGWEKPTWAMFAVIYCALGDEGESLHKGQMRILATFLGGGMSLLFTALFNDHRWTFGGAVLLWIMFCAYMMQNNRRYYIWFVAGWLTILMPIYSAEQPARAFEVVMLRLEETVLGVLIYTLVASVLMPDGKRKSFINQMHDQVAAVNEAVAHLARAYRGDPQALVNSDSALKLRNEALALHVNFRNRIDVGIVESFDVLENRDAWHRAIDELEALVQMLNRFRLALTDIQSAPHPKGLPDISAIADEIQRRLGQCVAILGGAQAAGPPLPVKLPRPALSDYDGDVFAHGAALVALDTLDQIERHSAHLLGALSEARGLSGSRQAPATVRPALPPTIIPDPERIASVLRIGVVFWTAFLLYLFVPELVGGSQIILLCTIIGMFISMRPTMPTFVPYVLGNIIIIIAAIIHMVLMPKVSSFLGLGTILLIYTFVVATLLSSAAVAPLRFLSLGFAAMILQITNEQTYSFTYAANMMFVFQAPFILIWLTQSFPVSFRPERAFQRLLRRYMTSFRALIDDLKHDDRAHPRGWWQRQVRGWHLRNLLRIPDQLNTWINVMPKAAMNGASRIEAHALCQSLFDLAARMVDYSRLEDVQYQPETVARLRPVIRSWREALQGLSDDIRDAPEKLPLADRLTEMLQSHLALVQDETRMAVNARAAGGEAPSDRTLLKELSVYRGLSESLISATRHAAALDWRQLREPRF